jgi:hypothetical protein
MRPKKTRMLRVPLATWTTTIDIAWHGMTANAIERAAKKVDNEIARESRR